MAPRSRSSLPAREPVQDSGTVGDVTASSLYTPDKDDTGEQPANFQRVAIAELDEYITTDRENLRLKRRREYVEARQRGEIPAINPLEFDDPVDTPPERPEPRPRHEGGARIQLPPLKFRGGNYAETQNFVFDLENRFRMFADDFKTDSQRIVYVASSLLGPIKTRWRNFLTLNHQADPDNVTWDEAKRWLSERVTDGVTRSYNAVTKLRSTYQREDQSFDQFLDAYEAIESELSFEVPDICRVCWLLSALKPDMRKQVLSMGIPGDYLALHAAARRAESLIQGGSTQPASRRAPTTSQRPPALIPTAPATLAFWTNLSLQLAARGMLGR